MAGGTWSRRRVMSTTERETRGHVDLYAALLQGRMRGSDALEACQQLLQALMDSSANAVFWKDLQSRYLGCNRVFAAFAGSEPDALLGKSDRDMPWADDAEFGADWFMGWDAHVAATGEPVVGIVERLRRASGDLRWVETNKVPLRDLDGRVIGILGTFEDVDGAAGGRGTAQPHARRPRQAGAAADARPRAGDREPAAGGRRPRPGAGRGTPAACVRRGAARHRRARCRRRSTSTRCSSRC